MGSHEFSGEEEVNPIGGGERGDAGVERSWVGKGIAVAMDSKGEREASERLLGSPVPAELWCLGKAAGGELGAQLLTRTRTES